MTQRTPISQEVLYCSKLPEAVDFALAVLTGLSEDERKSYGKGVNSPEEINTLVFGVVSYRLKNDFKFPEFNLESTREALAYTFYDLTVLYTRLFNKLCLLCETSLNYLHGQKTGIEQSKSELLFLRTLTHLTQDMRLDLKTFQTKTMPDRPLSENVTSSSWVAQFEMSVLKAQSMFELSVASRIGESLSKKWLGAAGVSNAFAEGATKRLQPFLLLVEEILSEFNQRIEQIDQHQCPSMLGLVEDAFNIYSALCLSREALSFKEFPRNDGAGYFIDTFSESSSRLPLNLFFGNSHAQRIALRNSIPGTWQKGRVPYQSYSQAFFEAHNCLFADFFSVDQSTPRQNRVIWRTAPNHQSSLF